ncbi:UPAR/Ly6 domain-containing protein crok-like [Brevipalpus obovatus]|uniref:UPAR/Ly6 domain-containing protein crok-like n=1 Tax=Brevipalpus obovatus TaxID=246614 RepID=UPI003D9F842B
MLSSQQILLTLGIFTFIALHHQAWSLECWDCTTRINVACGDPFFDKPFAKKNCTLDPRYAELRAQYPNQTIEMCRKITEKVDGMIHVIRSCGYLDDLKGDRMGRCQKRTESVGIMQESCVCYTDGCNSGIDLSPRFITALGSCFVSLIVLIRKSSL